jgi:hypothetical protein
MQNNAPSTTSPTSPTSTCRWKRGRPVSPRYGGTNPWIGTSDPSLSRLSLQSTNATGARSLGSHGQLRHVSTGQRLASSDDAEAEASISKKLQPTRLTDPIRAVRFAPTTDVEAQHITPTDDNGVSGPQQVAGLGISSHSSTHHSMQHTGSEGKYNAQQGASSTHAPAEHDISFDGETTSQEDNNMTQSSGSDYIPSQEEEDIANELLEEEENEEEKEVEEHIDLDYQIPEETLRGAMLASPQTRASFWSAKMYRGSEDQSLSTHYCRSFEVAERVAQHFLKEKVVGFDIEWRPFSSPTNVKQNASLIQLACEDRIALFHVSQFTGTTAEELMPPTLKIILESPDILKVGVAVKGDFTRLQRYLNVEAQGVFELSRLHNLVEWHATDSKKVTNKLVGLAAQVLKHLQLPLYKGEQLADDPADTANVRESDWSKPLDLQQIHYAAADAYAGFRLYHILEWKRKQLRPTPPTRGLCDFDAKRDPRPKAPKKKAIKKDKAAVTEGSTSSMEQDQEKQPQQKPMEVEDSEEEEGYETAPEEFMDSHELEDPDQASSMDSKPHALDGGITNVDTKPAQKRVGRVNLSWLRGPDPQYPLLPQYIEDRNASMSSPSLDTSDKPGASKQGVARSSHRDLLRSNMIEEDDEFADPELEEALQVLNLDEDGKLTDTPKSVTSADKGKGTRSSTAAHTKMKHTGNVADMSHHPDLDLVDYNPISHEIGEPPAALTSTTTADELSHSAEYNSATSWAQTYLESTVPSPSSTTPPRIRATIPHLRAYHLWHHQHLSSNVVASHLRDPPLSHSTVAGYILQAVTLERLDYDKDNLRDVMTGLPIGMRKGRWKWIAEKVGGAK